MKSLFILSLPRSLSTLTFHVVRDALGLREPAWAEIGEILNHDLHTLSNWPKVSDSNHKFLTRDRDPTRFTNVLEFLDQVANVEGYIYKDVVNPFVMAEWPGLKQFRVLKIERDLAEVVFALQNRGWHYVRLAAPPNATIGSRASPAFVDGYLWSVVGRRLLRERWHGRATAMLCTDAMILGLLRAERVLAKIPGESVQYDDLIAGEDALQQAMVRIYPQAAIGPLRYIDDAFRKERKAATARKATQSYKSLRKRIEVLREGLVQT